MTAEMHLALDRMREQGIRLYETRNAKRDCGCVVRRGFDTTAHEPALAFDPCSPEHRAAATVAQERFYTADAVERFGDVAAEESAMGFWNEAIREQEGQHV